MGPTLQSAKLFLAGLFGGAGFGACLGSLLGAVLGGPYSALVKSEDFGMIGTWIILIGFGAILGSILGALEGLMLLVLYVLRPDRRDGRLLGVLAGGLAAVPVGVGLSNMAQTPLSWSEFGLPWAVLCLCHGAALGGPLMELFGRLEPEA